MFFALPYTALSRSHIVESMFQVFYATCSSLKIPFVTTTEKLIYHDIYRLINCTVRYLRGVACDSNGGYLWYRLRTLCPDKLTEQIFKTVKSLSVKVQDDGMKRILAPFAQFHRGVTADGNFDPSFFYLPSFQELLPKIKWDSNALDVEWNPSSFTDRAGVEQEIWPKGKLSRAGPQRFLNWVRATMKPIYDPMYIILLIAKKLNLMNNKWYDEQSPKLFFLTDVSPRFVKDIVNNIDRER